MPEQGKETHQRVTLGEGEPLKADLKGRSAVVIGRGSECEIVIQDLKASRTHCRLSREGSSFVLEDLGSRNGTFVNGEKIAKPVTLQPNQTFKVGDTMFYIGH